MKAGKKKASSKLIYSQLNIIINIGKDKVIKKLIENKRK